MDNKISYCPRCDKYLKRLSLVCPFCGSLAPKLKVWESWSEQERKDFFENSPHLNPPKATESQEELKDAERFDAQYRAELAAEEARKQYVPHCPTCGCPDLEKVGAGEKLASVAVWGVFSKKPRVQFRCKNCGYEW